MLRSIHHWLSELFHVTIVIILALIVIVSPLSASNTMSLQDINKYHQTVDDLLKHDSAEGLNHMKAAATEEAAAIIMVLSIHKRAEDPFGISVIALPTPEEVQEATKSATQDEAHALTEQSLTDITAAARELKITGVEPSQNKFFIGSHPIYSGDTITVSRNGITYLFMVNVVATARVELTEKDSGTKITIPIYIIPSLHPKQVSEAP